MSNDWRNRLNQVGINFTQNRPNGNWQATSSTPGTPGTNTPAWRPPSYTPPQPGVQPPTNRGGEDYVRRIGGNVDQYRASHERMRALAQPGSGTPRPGVGQPPTPPQPGVQPEPDMGQPAGPTPPAVPFTQQVAQAITPPEFSDPYEAWKQGGRQGQRPY